MSQTEYTIEELLANYKGQPEYIRGPEGDIAFRKSLKTDALHAHRREHEERHADGRTRPMTSSPTTAGTSGTCSARARPRARTA